MKTVAGIDELVSSHQFLTAPTTRYPGKICLYPVRKPPCLHSIPNAEKQVLIKKCNILMPSMPLEKHSKDSP